MREITTKTAHFANIGGTSGAVCSGSDPLPPINPCKIREAPLLSQLTRAHPQSEDGEMRHRAAADIARLTEELRLARIEIKALEKFCTLLSENYDRLLASTRKGKP